MDHDRIDTSPTSPTYPDARIGRLFNACEHFLCWIVVHDKTLDQHRDFLRNLERIMRICEANFEGHFVNSLEEKHALNNLYHLTTGLENGDERWDDIYPATQLMLENMERDNPKSHAIGLTVALKHAFHDKTPATEALSLKLKEVTDYISSHINKDLSREQAVAINKEIESFLKLEHWDIGELIDLQNRLRELIG